MIKLIKEKQDRIKELLQNQTTYRNIQVILKEEFGGGISNTTLKKMNQEQDRIKQLEMENQKLREELQVFKTLYYELVEATKKLLNQTN
jgi:hypothetical protein